ncbi:MAG: rod shape-determining protein MreC [Patescibacteria group bacterium]
MKRTFLAKRNAIFSPANISWGNAALAAAVFLLLLRLLAPNLFWKIFTPAFRASDALAEASHAIFVSFSDTTKLALRNEELANENAALANENQALTKKVENISGLVPDVDGVTAGVVARPPLSPYDTLVLSAGSGDGVVLGMEAFGAGNVPIGIISSVSSDFSRATLFSAPGVTVNGWVGKNNLPLVIKGAGGGTMSASVARSANIVVGDTVFAPGPGMLPIGRVVRVDNDPSSTSVTLRITPALNLFSIAWVSLRDTGALLSATSTLP